MRSSNAAAAPHPFAQKIRFLDISGLKIAIGMRNFDFWRAGKKPPSAPNRLFRVMSWSSNTFCFERARVVFVATRYIDGYWKRCKLHETTIRWLLSIKQQAKHSKSNRTFAVICFWHFFSFLLQKTVLLLLLLLQFKRIAVCLVVVFIVYLGAHCVSFCFAAAASCFVPAAHLNHTVCSGFLFYCFSLFFSKQEEEVGKNAQSTEIHFVCGNGLCGAAKNQPCIPKTERIVCRDLHTVLCICSAIAHLHTFAQWEKIVSEKSVAVCVCDVALLGGAFLDAFLLLVFISFIFACTCVFVHGFPSFCCLCARCWKDRKKSQQKKKQ